MRAILKFFGITIGTIVTVMTAILMLSAISNRFAVAPSAVQSTQSLKDQYLQAQRKSAETSARVKAKMFTVPAPERRSLADEDFRDFKASQNAYWQMVNNASDPTDLLRMLAVNNPSATLDGSRLTGSFDLKDLDDFKVKSAKFVEITFRRWRSINFIDLRAKVKFSDGARPDYFGDAVILEFSREKAATIDWDNTVVATMNLLQHADSSWVHPAVFSSGLGGNMKELSPEVAASLSRK
jgi:hypothetical protein